MIVVENEIPRILVLKAVVGWVEWCWTVVNFAANELAAISYRQHGLSLALCLFAREKGFGCRRLSLTNTLYPIHSDAWPTETITFHSPLPRVRDITSTLKQANPSNPGPVRARSSAVDALHGLDSLHALGHVYPKVGCDREIYRRG